MPEHENFASNSFELYILLEQKRKDKSRLNIDSCFSLTERISSDVSEELKKQRLSFEEGTLVKWDSKKNISDVYVNLDENFAYIADAIGLVVDLKEDGSSILEIWAKNVKDVLLLYLAVLEDNKNHLEEKDRTLDMKATFDYELEEHSDKLVENWATLVEILPNGLKESVLKMISEDMEGNGNVEIEKKAIEFIGKYI